MRAKGFKAENAAIHYLINHGYDIIAQNFYTRFGELDIIAKKNRHLHIIEVKYLVKQHIHPAYKLTRPKKRRMIQCTQLFIDRHKLNHLYIQFDLITIINNRIEHLKHIFSLSDGW